MIHFYSFHIFLLDIFCHTSLEKYQGMEKFSVKWKNFQSNLTKSFQRLRHDGDHTDVTLMGDDYQPLQAHKVVLSASSEFFKGILKKADHAKPMIYLSGVKSTELYSILDYIYEGEVQLYQEDLDKFLDVAQKLKINGLLGDRIEDNKQEVPKEEKQNMLFWVPRSVLRHCI